jgi:RNA polymerase sigma-70 factor (ECF subfamily)
LRRLYFPALEGRALDIPADEDLIASIQSGDTRSLGVLVQRWERPLYRFVYRLLPKREEAQDICQETFLRVASKSRLFREGSRFSTWMYQIALNLTRDHVRKRTRWSALVLAADDGQEERAPLLTAGVAVTPDMELERKDTRESVRRALLQLPEEQKEVLVLKEYQGLKFREIAELLSCPESTVKSRMYYGLRSLKSALAKESDHGV